MRLRFSPHLPIFSCFITLSHCSEDEYEPPGVVPGRQQTQWPAGLSPAWQFAQVQLQHSDSGPAQQSHPRLWYAALIEHQYIQKDILYMYIFL